jgi:hypothetical protein
MNNLFLVVDFTMLIAVGTGVVIFVVVAIAMFKEPNK